MSLRRNLNIALYVLGILALVAALSLVAFTTYMSAAVTTLGDSVRSVYLAQRAEIDLLTHARTANPVVRSNLEEDLRKKLNEARQYAEGPRELETLSSAERNVNVSIWLAVFAFRPVFSIRDAMRKFARGDRSARAPEHGPAELRIIASQFNSMADSLARQRENQLAFLAGVAHDLRNPLSVLKLSTMTTSPERLPIMQRQVDYLDRMIGDLLDASRIEAGQLELRPEQDDARMLVRSVYELFRDLSPKHNLSIHVPEEPVMLSCDPLRIEQVLNNLVSNAIKYSPQGGRVEITLQDSADEAVISVSDQGIGIPADQRHHIFEPFKRAGLSKDQIPGIGLGLSVARRIVEAHDGRLEVQSEVGRGTAFYVRLPHKAGTAAA